MTWHNGTDGDCNCCSGGDCGGGLCIPKCRPAGSMSIDVTVPIGGFTPENCAACGDFSGSYNLISASPTTCSSWFYTNITYCTSCPNCGNWILTITGRVSCNPGDPGVCVWSASVGLSNTVLCAPFNCFQNWGYKAEVSGLGPHTLNYYTYVEHPIRPSAPCGSTPRSWPYDKDSFPASITVEGVIA